MKDGYHPIAAVKGDRWFVYFNKVSDFTATVYSFHDDFPEETIQEEWDNDHLVVIMAGYPEEMNTMLDSNPGLRSRFNRYFSFDHYTAEELTAIFTSFCSRTDNEISEEEREIVLQFFTYKLSIKDRHFGNARLARNLFEKASQYRAYRISKKEQITLEDLKRITTEDILSAAEYFKVS